MDTSATADTLGQDHLQLLTHTCQKIKNDQIRQPGYSAMQAVMQGSNRPQAVQASLSQLYAHGRLGKTGYLSIFPVDQGLEHNAAYSFYHNPSYFDPENIVKMAVAGGSSAVTASVGALGLVARRYADKIPLVVKINHSQHLTLPPQTDQIMFASIKAAHQMGAVGVGATVYFGSDNSPRQIEQIGRAIEQAHEMGMFAIIWCYPRNDRYQHQGKDYSTSVDITAQAIHMAVSMGADIVKQKMPDILHGFEDLEVAKSDPQMYNKLLSDHPIDLVRYQVMHAFAGKIGLLNSGGEAGGEDDLREAVRAAVINKRAGGQGIIMGRKVFKKSWEEGLKMLWAVQDVYLDQSISVA